MKGEKCPVCGRYSYFCTTGIYDREVGEKVTPDEYHCTQCGFRYSEDYRPKYSEENAVKLYKANMNKRRKNGKNTGFKQARKKGDLGPLF